MITNVLEQNNEPVSSVHCAACCTRRVQSCRTGGRGNKFVNREVLTSLGKWSSDDARTLCLPPRLVVS